MDIETSQEQEQQQEHEQVEQQQEVETTGEQQDDQQAQNVEDDGEVVVTFGDEAPAAQEQDEIGGQPAPSWVKELRKEAKEAKKRIRELEAEKAQREASSVQKADPVGEKPTLESCDYDAEAYAEKVLAWTERKRQADAQEAAARQEQEAAATAWKQKIDSYNTAKASLKVSDFDDAEHVVTSTLNATQQGIILKLSKPEVMVYYAGKNPAKAKELAAIKDPIDFAFAVAKLETQLKVQPLKQPPAAERKVTGTAGGATGVDNTLARLQAEADKTGDRSKVAQYYRDQARKNAA